MQEFVGRFRKCAGIVVREREIRLVKPSLTSCWIGRQLARIYDPRMFRLEYSIFVERIRAGFGRAELAAI